jgi:plastocyanin
MGLNAKLGALMLVVSFLFFGALLYAGVSLIDEAPASGEEATEAPPSSPGAGADSGAAAPGGGAAAPGAPVAVTIAAKSLAFDKRTIEAAPGSQVTVTFDNQDAGVLHNVAFYTNRAASRAIFVGELFPGVAQKIESFSAPSAAGNYFFRCDAHPDAMTGTFAIR